MTHLGKIHGNYKNKQIISELKNNFDVVCRNLIFTDFPASN